MKNFNIFGVHAKILVLMGGGGEGGGVTKNQYLGGDCQKGGACTACRFKEGALQERGGWCFWGGGWYPMHTSLFGRI